jgi:polysaccharide export outer membrane protein
MRNLYQILVGVLMAVMLGISSAAAAETAQGKPVTMSATVTPDAVKVSDSNDYHIGSLDLLEIKVLQDANMARTLRVDARGNISMPLIGVVHAAGLSSNELEQLIAAKLEADYMQNPQVSVFIKEFTSQRVTVQGLVKKPGMYDFQGRASLLQAVSMGGGLDVKADENAIKVIRKQAEGDTQTLVFNLWDIMHNKAPNPILKGGDIVIVDEAQPITVEGAVIRSGVFYLSEHPPPTLMQVIAQSGGLQELADPHTIKVYAANDIYKKSSLEYDLDKIRDGQINDPHLHAGDLVVVERSALRSAIRGITDTLRGFVGFGNVQ